MPLKSSKVDTNFAGVTSGVGTTTAAFMNLGTSNAKLLAPGAVISYAGGIFTAASTAYLMDGTDKVSALYGLTNASLDTNTNSEEVVTYDSSTGGYNLSLPTSKSWSVSLAGVADFKDSGYHVLRLTEQNTVKDSLKVKFARVGPTGTSEVVYGYGALSGYKESIQAGSIVSWEVTLEGYGAYNLGLDFNT